MNGEELAILINALALSSAKCLSIDDLNILVAVFTQLADTYATISVIRSIEESKTAAQSERNETSQTEEDIIALETT